MSRVTIRHLAVLAAASALPFLELAYGLTFRGTGDLWLNVLPLYKFALDRLAHLQFPMWNPFVASGYNFMGDTLNPSFDWTMWFVIPFSHSKFWFLNLLTLRLYLLLFGSGAFVYFGLLRKTAPLPALFGASSFILSPAMMWSVSAMGTVISLFYLSILIYLLATEDDRSHLRSFLWLSLTVGLMFISGLLSQGAFAWLGALIVRFSFQERHFAKRALIFIGAAFAGVALASAKLMPLIIAGFESNRINPDPTRFLQTGAQTLLVRTLIPEFLGWNAVGATSALSFESANLSYFGIIGLLLALAAFWSDKTWLHRNRIALWCFGLTVLATTYTPYVYQLAVSLFAPLVTGDPLYLNLLFPTISALVVAQSVMSLMNLSLSAKTVEDIVYRLSIVLFIIFLVLFSFLPYFSGVVKPSLASLITKASLALLLLVVTFQPKPWAVKTGLYVLSGVALLTLLMPVASLVNMLIQFSNPHHAFYFIINSSLVLVTLITAYPVLWITRRMGEPRWAPLAQLGVPLCASILALIFSASTLLNPYDVMEFPLVPSAMTSSMYSVAKFGVMAGASLYCLRQILLGLWAPRVGFYLLLLLHIANLGGYGKNYISSAAMPFKDIEEIYPDRLRQTDRVGERFASKHEGLQGIIDNLPVWYKIRNAGGYLNIASKEYAEVTGELLKSDMSLQFRPFIVPPGNRFTELTATNDWFDSKLNLNPMPEGGIRTQRASVVFQAEAIPASGERLKRLASPDFKVKDSLILEDGTGQFSLEPAGTVEIVEDAYDKMRFKTQLQNPGFFLLRDSFDKGWTAQVNGSNVPILRANHAFMTVALPPGSHSIEFRFWPRGFTAGLIVSALMALTLAAGFSLRHRRP